MIRHTLVQQTIESDSSIVMPQQTLLKTNSSSCIVDL